MHRRRRILYCRPREPCSAIDYKKDLRQYINTAKDELLILEQTKTKRKNHLKNLERQIADNQHVESIVKVTKAVGQDEVDNLGRSIKNAESTSRSTKVAWRQTQQNLQSTFEDTRMERENQLHTLQQCINDNQTEHSTLMDSIGWFHIMGRCT